MATPYKINIPLYEGPLDLLLDLIKKQEMNIHDIPIAKITSQYLDYLHKLEDLNVDVSADFVYMAATLIYIKSKMLLPPDPLASPEEQTADPRADLVQRLVEHAQLLASEDNTVNLIHFFEACPSRHAMIVAFLAVLEMVKMQAVAMVQEKQFGEILLRKAKMFDIVFDENGALRQISEEYR